MKVTLYVLALLLVANLASAATMTGAVTTLAAQDTFIQTVVIPSVNTARCAQFRLPSSCTSAQLVTNGCIAVAFNTLSKATVGTFQSCTIYTQDATGENNLAADELSIKIQDRIFQELSNDVTASCAAFKAATQANRDSICTTLGRPAGCRICP